MKNTIKKSFLLGTVLVLSIGSLRASGVVSYVTYSDSASFMAAAGGGLATANFDTLANNTYQTLSSSTPGIPVGVVFSSTQGAANDLFVAPTGFNGESAITSPSLFA